MQKTLITGMGHFHPSNIIKNSFFDSLNIGSEASWVADRTGIQSRCSVLSESSIVKLYQEQTSLEVLRDQGEVMSIAEMADEAWQQLKGRSPEIEASSLRSLICGTSVPDFDIPANACSVAAKIGSPATAFDVNSACSSFVVNLHVGQSMISCNPDQKIGIFNPERYSLKMNYHDRNSCVLFGDGCTAAVLETSCSNKPGLEVIDTYIESDPSNFELVKIPDSGLFSQNGKAVQKFAISKTIEVTQKILHRNQLSANEIDYFIGHQANLRMISSAAERLKLTKEKHLFNVDKFGNQGSAGAPSVLSMNWEKFQKGDLIVVAVVGSGLTWGAALLQKV